MKPLILIIVNLNEESLAGPVGFLNDQKYEILTCQEETEALGILLKKNINIIISGLFSPHIKETAFLKKVKMLRPHAEVIFLSNQFTTGKLMRLIKAGAYELLKWPTEEASLLQTIHNALEKQTLALKNDALEKSLREKPLFHEIIGKSKEIRGVLDMALAVSVKKGNVLICGESGTGKELVARAIHFNSSRRNGPFIKVNCAALSDGVLESELFGHEKGAFTGAMTKRIGRFELAHKGTLFIDEVADIPMATQVKLLRVLQEREFERVGGNETIRVDVRIITATNRDLSKAVEEKSFREDLYYRLNVIQINMPPLRKRKGDIPLLVSHFIEKFNREEGHSIRGVTKETMQVFMNYHWPGNIRELENAMVSAMTLAKDRFVEAKYLPSSVLFGSSTDEGFYFPFGLSLKAMEEEVLRVTLEKFKGNRTKTARVLGISLRTLQRKLARQSDEREA